MPINVLLGCSEAVNSKHSRQVNRFIKDELLLHRGQGVDALAVGKAAGEDADISCTVSLQPLLVNYKRVGERNIKRR